MANRGFNRRALCKIAQRKFSEDLSCFDLLSLLSERERSSILSGYSDSDVEALLYDWSFMGRPSQQKPNYKKKPWTTWLIQAGRGFGKTRTGSETIKKWQQQGYGYFALVGRTAEDVRKTMIEEGESSLLKCYPKSWETWNPDHYPKYEPSKKLVRWGNGATAHVYYDEEPRKLEGPQQEKAWCDETAGWSNMAETFAHLQFGLRLGRRPQVIVTTTPKRRRAYKKLFYADAVKDDVVITLGTSYQNISNLSELYINKIIKPFEGTTLGRQMLLGELVEDVDGTLWTDAVIDDHRVTHVSHDALSRIVVAVDPSVTGFSKEHGDDRDSNMCGIVVTGEGYNGHKYVLGDFTVRAKPEVWARAVCVAHYKFQADCVIGEVNNGGDLVESVIKAEDSSIPYKSVRATRGKHVRAEPIAIMYQRGEVHHVKGRDLELLEEQMCDWIPGDGESPDRVDALVWGLTELASDGDMASWLALTNY